MELSPVGVRDAAEYGDQGPLGTLARSQLILQILGRIYPTPALSAAYFENLDHLLSKRGKLASPGQLVLGRPRYWPLRINELDCADGNRRGQRLRPHPPRRRHRRLKIDPH